MSPERLNERKRPSKGWAIHERRRKAEERRSQPLQITTNEDRINRFAIPSWEKIEGILELKTHNNPDLYALSFRHRGILKDFYNARYQITTTGDRTLYEQFVEKYTQKEKLMNDLSPHFTLIRDSVSVVPPRKK